ncbi:MAG: hypothetical protein GY928_08515 [Colwellia sp.]|nr:hypothetical protein [Colwellia sp.]
MQLFNNLKSRITTACIEGGIPDNTRDYYINKVASRIKNYPQDVYEIFVGTKNYHLSEGNFSHFKVDSIDGTLYVSVKVD